MDQTTEQAIRVFMAKKLSEGVSLSEIQTLVNQEFHCAYTYMDIRILASELDGIDWRALDPQAAARAKEEAKKKAAEAEKQPPAEAGSDAPEDGDLPEDGDALPPSDGKTLVELSKLARPGMMLSGTVRFASGSTAEWYVDNTGRLGLENLKGAKPTREDVEAFQIELDRVARKALGGR